MFFTPVDKITFTSEVLLTTISITGNRVLGTPNLCSGLGK